ncbi:MAG TPA: ABC transporter substrate-binding protein [Chloroflexota bacterium]|nr:ABC transporter substrate-binding protein [Chloroflexota bacterium]
MTVAYSEITFINLPLWTAKADGIFEKHGLDVDLQNIDSSTSIAALVSGQVQAAAAGGSEALSAAVEGADLQTVAVLGGQYPYVLMAPASIQTPDDLRGKKVGVSRAGSSSDIATRVVLKRLGLDPDNDVTIIAVGSLANRTAALLSGSIDAGLDSPPGSLKEEAQGLHVLVDIASLKIPAANNVVTLQKSFVDQNKDVVQRFVDSLMEGSARARSDRAGSIKLLKDYYKSDDDAMMGKTFDFFLEATAGSMAPQDDEFGDVIVQLSAKNPSVKDYDLSKILVTSFVSDATARKVGETTSMPVGTGG